MHGKILKFIVIAYINQGPREDRQDVGDEKGYLERVHPYPEEGRTRTLWVLRAFHPTASQPCMPLDHKYTKCNVTQGRVNFPTAQRLQNK